MGWGVPFIENQKNPTFQSCKVSNVSKFRIFKVSKFQSLKVSKIQKLHFTFLNINPISKFPKNLLNILNISSLFGHNFLTFSKSQIGEILRCSKIMFVEMIRIFKLFEIVWCPQNKVLGIMVTSITSESHANQMFSGFLK